MPFRFRKIIPLGKGFHINLSKGGISSSMGGKGYHLNLGKRGIKSTISAPGTGLSYSTNLSGKSKDNALTQGITWIIIAGVILFLCIACACIFLFSGIIIPTNSTPTATKATSNISTIIVQTANKASTQTALFFSPTAAITSTSLPTLTPPFIPSSQITETPNPTNTIIFILPSNIPSSGSCSCTGTDLNCGNFSTHAEAQACFDSCKSQGYGDIFGLDRDNNGLACENLK